MSRVLFLSTSSLGLYHLGVEMELIQKYLDDGHAVDVLSCNCDLKTCYFNATQNIIGCAACISARSSAYDIFGKDKFIEHEFVKNAVFPKFPVFNSLDELLNYNYKNINIGRGAASSLISLYLDYEIKREQADRQYVIHELLKSAILTTESILNILSKNQFVEMVIFNGRFAEVFPAMEIAKLKNIPYKTHERGATLEKYQLSTNSLPHSISYRTQLMNKLWDEAPSEKVKIAQEWLDGQSFAIKGDKNRFTKNQIKNKLPKNFNRKKINIVIFNSSEHETKVIREWKFPCYSHQNEALKKIFEHYSESTIYHFYLRVHPHLTNVDSIQTQEIKSFDYPNLTVIQADSDIDSYTLAIESNKVISFGSTIGIESTYLGLCSILFGRSLYENIDVCYTPQSYEDLFSLIEKQDLAAKEKSNTLPYAYYRCTYGDTPIHLKYISKNQIYFKGKRIKPKPIKMIFPIVRNIFKLTHWNKLNKYLVGQPVKLSNLLKLKSHFKKTV